MARHSHAAQFIQICQLQRPEEIFLDFKTVYNTPNEAVALSELKSIKEVLERKYFYAVSNLENNWEDVSPFFQFPDDIRRIMYITNIIEGLN